MAARARAVMVLLAAASGCGRVGFAPVGDAAAGDNAILAVSPIWAGLDGARIEVTLSGAAAGATVTLDGSACTSPQLLDEHRLQCTAAPHVAAVVEVAVLAADGTRAVFDRRFSYQTPGPYQLGGPLDDRTSGVAIDLDGNVYVSGATTGSLGGANAGAEDALLVKYDAAGTVAWVRQFGTPEFDYVRDVAVGPAGEVTIVGYSAGDIDEDGTPPVGNDLFVARFAPDGTRRWITQTGTPGDDQAWDLAVDASGAVVVAARTTGAFAPASNAGGLDYLVLRFSPDGALEWARQGGSAAVDQGHSVTVTPDGITYLVGYTDGVVEPGATNAGGVDLFVARYERDGTPTWIRQRGGAGDDRAQDVAVDDAGEVWIAGETSGALDGNPGAGGRDVFVMRMSASGVWAFTRVHGSPATETTYGVAVTPSGEVYVSCVTGAAFDGQSYVGGSNDACVIAFDRAGNHVWTRITGTTAGDSPSSCAVDVAYTGLIYVSLNTNGALDGQPARGAEDLGLIKLDAAGNLH